MKRFIRYLYEYDQGKRMRNVGFVKVEQEDGSCTVHIHGKGFFSGGSKEITFYFFYVKNGQCIGIPYERQTYSGPTLNEVLRYDRAGDNFTEHYDEINGVILEGEQGRRFGAVWDDSPVDISGMKVQEKIQKAEERPMREEKPEMEERPMREEKPEMEEEPMREEKSEVEEEPMREELSEESTAIGSEMYPGMQINISLQKQRFKARKIQRMEISKLARCEWKLANNNFLMHGYYNYHHLVFLENDSQFMLGVPGIYHEKEARAAEIFGFPKFISMDEIEISLNPEEKNDKEKFGYWCRPVKHQVRWE